MGKSLIIIGAGGHGRVTADAAVQMGLWDRVFFADDRPDLSNTAGHEVIGTVEQAFAYIDRSDYIVAVGSGRIRRNIQVSLESRGAGLATIIHPSAIIGSEVLLGRGTVVMAGAVIQCSTAIGKGCIINTRAAIDHDNTIGDYVHISPGVCLAGNVSVGDHTWMGIGSAVIHNITIAANCMVGAGSAVIRDLTEAGTYVGVPVRRL
ncbi:acetyltransferase [Paenibacillus lemnae]|uniref:Acetyltransferase n=1 Tax=Paenibacillus lemnae TaxID=1330551 RepID=A0A848M974_PAELE|nr:acetyltransferase [Paenibacillus lemnae]NMO96632.1 acetyltransferase [Paenibacillus lemnae]